VSERLASEHNLSYLTGMSEHNFIRSPHRDAIIETIATAPAEGAPIAEIMQIPGVGSRDNADHLLMRMVKAGEIVRVGRGRYGPLRRRAVLPPRADVAPIPAAAPAPAANGFWRRSKKISSRRCRHDEDTPFYCRSACQRREHARDVSRAARRPDHNGCATHPIQRRAGRTATR
jgi:hypothetical protein